MRLIFFAALREKIFILPQRARRGAQRDTKKYIMKLRIKGNSIRYRLSKTDVNTIAADGYLEENTNFGSSVFTYALQVADISELGIELGNNKITIQVPAAFIQHWPQNDVVGCDAYKPLDDGEKLYLLLEKDFVCLDETMEDQSDNFDNPNKTC